MKSQLLQGYMTKIGPDFSAKFFDNSNILVSVVDCTQVC